MSVKNLSRPFMKWISDLGTKKVSELLDCEMAAVRHWRNGVCMPRTDQMYRIRKLTRGVVGYEAMIDGFYQDKKRKDALRRARKRITSAIGS